MTDTRICIVRTDGNVEIMQLAEGGSFDRALEQWKLINPGLYVSHYEIKLSDLPTERTFRNAWKANGDKVKVDMPKAREIWRDTMRRSRAPILAALDIEYQRADEQGDADAKMAVVAKKQKLRDVTADPAIDAAKTPEELKAVWPEVLG